MAERFPEAVEQFKIAIEIDPINGYDVKDLSRTLDHLNRQGETIGQLQSIINEHKFDEDESAKAIAFNKWGQVLAKIKLYDEAIEQFKRALGLANDLDNAFDFEKLAEVLDNIDTPDEALRSIQEAVKNQKNAQAHNNWGKTLHKMGKYPAAVDQYKKAISKNNKLVEAHCNLGNTLIKLGNYDDATKSFDNALKIDDCCVEAYSGLGRALIQQEKYDEAIKCYEQAMDKNARSAEYWVPWRQAISKLDNQRIAISQYRKALEKVYDSRSEYMFHWGNFLIELGKYNLGLTKHVKAFALEPTKYTFDDGLNEALANVENPDETLEKFQKTVTAQHDAEVYYQWGNFLLSLSNYEMALKPLFYAFIEFSKDQDNDDRFRLSFLRQYIDNIILLEKSENQSDVIESLQEWIAELKEAEASIRWATIGSMSNFV